MKIIEGDVIGELVAKDYRTAAVFQSSGIDFCCKGDRTISEVCNINNLESDELIENLSAVMNQQQKEVDYDSWPIDLLADYIEKKHHRYVEEKTAEIKPYLEKIVRVHGENHPELKEIEDLFLKSAGLLAAHMKKEELILFPFVRKITELKKGEKIGSRQFGSVENPVDMMKDEHENEGERFRKIEELSNNYTPPADGCNTYKVTFALLKEFQDDLHLHIHLENNILFPKAISKEKEMNLS